MTQGLFILMALICSLTYILLRDELKILSKLHAFAGNPLSGAVCTNCFEKCTYFFANIKDELRNTPNLLRKTVVLPDMNYGNSLDDSYSIEMQKAALLKYAMYIHFKSTNLRITVCGILIETKCLNYWWYGQSPKIWLHPLACLSHCKANMVHNSGPYFIWDAPLSLASSASSSVLPLYPSTMHPYSSSSSLLLTLIVSWMFIHHQNL